MFSEECRDYIYSKVPHGHEGTFSGTMEDVFDMSEILIRNGYAVLFTSGDTRGEYKIHWIYSGTPENLKYADYNEICFTSNDIFEEYLEIMREEWRGI